MDSFKASVAIGGMTCVACSNNIVNALKVKDWISDVNVNLVTHSASVEFVGDKAAQVVEAIEELGYDAQLNDVVHCADAQSSPGHTRTVEIFIDGIYCDLCPGRAINSLAGLQLKIISEPTRKSPIMKLTYSPGTEPANLNIRRILAAVNGCDTCLKAALHQPQTVEDRAKGMQIREQKLAFVRFLLTLVAAVPTFVIGIVYMNLVRDDNPTRKYFMAPLSHGISRAQMALCILATPVYLFAADAFHRRAAKEIWTLWKPGSHTPLMQRFYRFGSMSMLMSLGTTIAYMSSCGQLIAAATASDQSSGMVDDSNFYFDSVVFLTLFLLAGRLIEAYSKSKTGDAVGNLRKLRPTTAILVDAEGHPELHQRTTQVINIELLDFGDIVLIPYGASPPLDGKVVYGGTDFDESSLTGESRPVSKIVGDQVFAGTVNKGTPIYVQVTGAAGQSMLDQIVKVVQEGQTKRAPIENFADTVTAYFVPVITLAAVITWLVWYTLGTTGALPADYLEGSSSWVAFSFQFAIAVFVVACPCGLGLAAPTAIYVGGGLAARHGILARGGGEGFEKASKVTCVVFDKTGTITVGGEPNITNYELIPDGEGQRQELAHKQGRQLQLLGIIRGIEQNSSHPIAKALVSFCSSEMKQLMSHQPDPVVYEGPEAVDVEELPGKGMKGSFVDKELNRTLDVIIGNEALMHEFKVPVAGPVTVSLDLWKGQAKSIALVAISPENSEAEYQVMAAFAMADRIRPEALPVVSALQARGTDVWMLSGDNIITAQAVAQQIGIPQSNVIAEVLPIDKSSRIEELQMSIKPDGHGRATVAMVGDGINDAPALAKADVGIAVGSGSDIAISSAHFVLVKSDLRSVVTLLGLSRTVFRRVKINFIWACIYNVIAVPVAAGCLYAIRVPGGGHVKLDPVWASLAMALSSISVVLSSLALRGVPGLEFKEKEIIIGDV
ncbi:ATPase, P-type, K/Mg/Cd/Cu/Zn/Na/Ca/Na/H-transporter [Xylariales sp. AK1849]|nr:ATPase, P-type, K/Mg/Cd/Cu/Zn/Na/Ca/Na/H-transporter [Xylariales sp. AK1849]